MKLLIAINKQERNLAKILAARRNHVAVSLLKRHIQGAIADAANDISGPGGALNLVSRIGDSVSFHLRRRIVLDVINAAAWNITHAAETLGYSDPSALHREIRRLGLIEEYRAAKLRGDVRPGGHRQRVTMAVVGPLPDRKPA